MGTLGMTRHRLMTVAMLVALAACFLGVLVFTPASPDWLLHLFRQ